MKHTRTRFLTFLDADDVMNARFVERALIFLHTHPDVNVLHIREERRVFNSIQTYVPDSYAWAQPFDCGEAGVLKNRENAQLKRLFAQSGNASTLHGKIIETDLFRSALRHVKASAPHIFSTGLFYGEDTLLMGAVYALPEAVYSHLTEFSDYTGYFYNVRPSRGVRRSLEEREQSTVRARQTLQVYDCLAGLYVGLGSHIEDRLLQAALQQIRDAKST